MSWHGLSRYIHIHNTWPIILIFYIINIIPIPGGSSEFVIQQEVPSLMPTLRAWITLSDFWKTLSGECVIHSLLRSVGFFLKNATPRFGNVLSSSFWRLFWFFRIYILGLELVIITILSLRRKSLVAKSVSEKEVFDISPLYRVVPWFSYISVRFGLFGENHGVEITVQIKKEKINY
jgi:hypothetical protein